MQELSKKTMEYIRLGHNPTLISFPDNGLPEMLHILRRNKEFAQGVENNYAIFEISLKYVPELSPLNIETAIESEFAMSDIYSENSFLEIVKAGFNVIVLVDDLDEIENPGTASMALDALLKKYRGKLSFIYLVEDPSFLTKYANDLSPTSSVQDALIYHQIGEDWTLAELGRVSAEQYRQEISPIQIMQISKDSNDHYEIFKRLYRDVVFGTEQAHLYLESMLSDFDLDEINTFKKIVTGAPLSSHEKKLKEDFQKVGFISETDELTIPVIADKLPSYRIKGKLKLDEGSNRLAGLDLDLLTRSEKKIIEYLLTENTEVDKDELADVIWGDKVNEKYSEWAIDQRMSRLRKKLKDLGFNIDVKTVYGKGYRLVLLDE